MDGLKDWVGDKFRWFGFVKRIVDDKYTMKELDLREGRNPRGRPHRNGEIF